MFTGACGKRPSEDSQSWHPAHEPLDLIASLLSAYTPFTEMLTVVGEQSVTILSQARPSAINDLPRIVPRRHAASHRYGSTPTKIPQRNFLHRSPGEETRNRPAVNDSSAAQVDAMMDIADARGDEMRAERRLLGPFEHTVLPSRQGILKACRMGFSSASDEAPKPSHLSGPDRRPQ